MIKDPNEYFRRGCGRCKRFDTPECSAQVWNDGLRQLRHICLDLGLEETAKWGQPCYMLNGKNIAMLGAFRGDFCLTFMKGSLLKDPEGILTKRGENTQVANIISFTSNDQVKEMEPTLRAYLAEAIANEKAGLKPEKKVVNYDMPEELVDALDNDPDLAEAWENLTPGRQRGYCFHIGSAKQAQTRLNRIEKFRPKIFEGKGYLE